MIISKREALMLVKLYTMNQTQFDASCPELDDLMTNLEQFLVFEPDECKPVAEECKHPCEKCTVPCKQPSEKSSPEEEKLVTIPIIVYAEDLHDLPPLTTSDLDDPKTSIEFSVNYDHDESQVRRVDLLENEVIRCSCVKYIKRERHVFAVWNDYVDPREFPVPGLYKRAWKELFPLGKVMEVK